MERKERLSWAKKVTAEIYEAVEMGFYQKEDLESINFMEIREWIDFTDQENIQEIDEIIHEVCLVIYQIKFDSEYPI